MTSSPVYGLVLAGGKSSRMGRDKALLDRFGVSQLAYSVDLLSACVDEVFVSTRQDQTDEGERSRYQQIVDRYEELKDYPLLISPVWGEIETEELAEWIKNSGKPFRLQLQLHKLIWPKTERGV